MSIKKTSRNAMKLECKKSCINLLIMLNLKRLLTSIIMELNLILTKTNDNYRDNYLNN
jgi:hypothetical protein